MYPYRITNTEIILNPFEDMVKRGQVAARTENDVKKTKKPKRKAGKALVSFGGDEGDEEAVLAPVAKKAKYNTKLVSAAAPAAPLTQRSTPTSKPSKEEERSMPIREPAAKLASSPPPSKRKPPPAPRESSPESEKQSKLDRVNAQIAELKASMKRNVPTQNQESTKKKSLLESMVPSSTMRGRKRGAAASNAAAEQATLDLLANFKSKLESAAPLSKVKSPEAVDANGTTAPEASNINTVDEEIPCDLHFVVGCQSCTAWDQQDQEESDDDGGWMSHSLSFAKDRLGKDLEWKRKNEEELLVIDPREKAKEYKADQRKKRDWDDGKEKRKVKI